MVEIIDFDHMHILFYIGSVIEVPKLSNQLFQTIAAESAYFR
jgi:hypothetical protein